MLVSLCEGREGKGCGLEQMEEKGLDLWMGT